MIQSILAVDDEPHMLKLLERIITEKTPYKIVTTNNALEVPGLLEKARFDLIITDLKMPGMDGLDLLRLVKEKGRPEEVIIITAFGTMDSAVAALSHGVFDYITKPFKKEQIIFTIDRAMRWQKMKEDTRRQSEIFDIEPFEEARQAFEREYFRRLSFRCAGEEDAMVRRSGLSAELLARFKESGESKAD